MSPRPLSLRTLHSLKKKRRRVMEFLNSSAEMQQADEAITAVLGFVGTEPRPPPLGTPRLVFQRRAEPRHTLGPLAGIPRFFPRADLGLLHLVFCLAAQAPGPHCEAIPRHEQSIAE
ncbi:hypothetical protein ANANG_G00091770 [Anguilla anguilla]|uniref:Uncharacterized protein n=1 Tax=Anguilla anguilla TaxID=7936 RepID=A0A9D3S120_ANGAN|nr:hypothetical protein ANANG_G00091770 [Anguilla anguilla]